MIGTLKQILAEEGRRVAGSLRRNALLYGVAALCGLTTVLAVIAAAGLALAEAIGPVAAALVIAAGFFCLGGLLILAAARCNRRDRARMRQSRAIAALALSGGRLAAEAIRRKPLLVVLGAAIAAVVLASLRDRPSSN